MFTFLIKWATYLSIRSPRVAVRIRLQRLFETLRKLWHKQYIILILLWCSFKTIHKNSLCRDQIRLRSSFAPNTNYHKGGFPNKCLQCIQSKFTLFFKTWFFGENSSALHFTISMTLQNFRNKEFSNKDLQGIPLILTHLV